MSDRNDRLWHDVHDVHWEMVPVKVLRDGDLDSYGYVVEITNTNFIVREVASIVRHYYSFTDSQLRIER